MTRWLWVNGTGAKDGEKVNSSQGPLQVFRPTQLGLRFFPVTAASLAFSLWLVGCASPYTRPLTSRGLPPEERKDYVIQNGYGIPENIKQSYLDGFVEVGMARELVFQLYGAPDRTTSGDTNWEYVNNRGTLITGITFKNDKVEKVYGDPKGGANAEAKGKTGL